MTLENFIKRVRQSIPTATAQVADDVDIIAVLNQGVIDVTSQSGCLKSNKKFDVVSGQSEYVLSSVIGDYLNVDKSGLWWNNGTDFREVYPRTLEALDQQIPNWRTLTDGDPRWYSIDGDIITIVQTPSTSLTQGFWLYYIKSPVAMANPTDNSFVGSGIALPQLSIFDEAIIRYAVWKISPMLTKDTLLDITEQAYLKELARQINNYNNRRDLGSDAKFRSTPIDAE